MSFHEVQFPPAISRGSAGGPVLRTNVVGKRSGHEQRTAIWASSRRKYNAGYGLRTMDDLYYAIEFFENRQGRLHGFRWKDWSDFKTCAPMQQISATDALIGTGDGSTRHYALSKGYTSGSQSRGRRITKPIAPTVRVAVNGSRVSAVVDPTVGVVVLSSPPPQGALVTAGFEFDVPVRFDQDEIMVNVDTFNAGSIPDLAVVELKQKGDTMDYSEVTTSLLEPTDNP